MRYLCTRPTCWSRIATELNSNVCHRLHLGFPCTLKQITQQTFANLPIAPGSPSQSCDFQLDTSGHTKVSREKATVAYNPWRIHGTGIFTYMNGWFLWYPHVKYIPLPLISISKTTLLRWHILAPPPTPTSPQASPPSLATSLTQCVWQLRSFWTKHRHTTVYLNVPPWWKQHLGPKTI